MDKTKIAITGLGGVSQIMHIPSLMKMKEVDICAVCDIDTTKAKIISKKYGIKKYFSDAQTMLSELPEIEAVIIATQTNTHKDIAVKCLSAGKNVFIEKPIALNYKETKPIVETAEKNNKILMVGMNNRFRNDFMMQRSFVKGNELGEIYYVKTGWLKTQSSTQKWFLEREKSGGGVFIDIGIVLLDLGMWMLGFPEVRSVSSVNYYHNTKKVEDSNFTLVKFKNGSTLTIEVSWSFLRGGEFFYCNVFGLKGSSSINPLKIFKKMDGSLYDITPKIIKSSGNVDKSGFENEMKHFIGAVKGLHPISSSGKESLAVMKIVESVYKSAKTGREVAM